MRISDWSSDVCSSDLIDLDLRQVIAQVDAVIGKQHGALGQAHAFTFAHGYRGLDDSGHGLIIATTIARRQIALLYRRGRRHDRHALDQIGQLADIAGPVVRSEEHTSELQSLMRISYAVFCLKKK